MKLSVHISQQCWQDVDWASLVIALLLTPWCFQHKTAAGGICVTYPNFSLCLPPPRPAPQFSPVFGWKGFQYNSLCFYIINYLRCLQKPRFSVCITADMVDKIAAVHNMWQWGSSKMRQESGGGRKKIANLFNLSCRHKTSKQNKSINKWHIKIHKTMKR